MIRASDWIPQNEAPTLAVRDSCSQKTDIENVISEIERMEVDITVVRDNWLKIGFAFAAEYGDDGREYFHRVSRFYPNYTEEEANKQYDECLISDQKERLQKVTIASFYSIAKEYGINISHIPAQKEWEERKNGVLGRMGNVGNMANGGNLFVIRTANQLMGESAKQAPRKCYFYGLITEGENTIFVGDTGIGKTILVMQIAESLARLGLIVLYFDLELSDKQFEERYSETSEEVMGTGENRQRIVHCSNPYQFPESLYIVKFADVNIPDGITYEDFFLTSLESYIQNTKPQVIIIDNMSKLCSSDTDQAKTAKPMMDKLCMLKNRYSVTTIILEHRRKTDARMPLELNQMQGSKMKSNLIDNVVGIAASENDVGIRYVKELKVRSRRWEYTPDNVLVLELTKDVNRLRFDVKGTSPESDHIKQVDASDADYIKNEAIRLYQNGCTIVEIGNMLHKSKSAIGRIIKTFKDGRNSQNSQIPEGTQVGNGKTNDLPE